MAGDFCVFICAVPTRTVIAAPNTPAKKIAKSRAVGSSGWNGRRPSSRARRVFYCNPRNWVCCVPLGVVRSTV